MTGRTARLGIHEIHLLEWRLLLGALRTRYEVGSFAAAAAFVNDLERLVDAAEDGYPVVELREGYVQISLSRHDGGVTDRDVAMAERIGRLASDHELISHPEQVQVLEIALDTAAPDELTAFWLAALGRDGGHGLGGSTGDGPPLWFQATDASAPDRQRFHLDITVPSEVVDRRIAAAVAAGGRIVDSSHAPAFVVLSDPDGNNVCLCTELGRD